MYVCRVTYAIYSSIYKQINIIVYATYNSIYKQTNINVIY